MPGASRKVVFIVLLLIIAVMPYRSVHAATPIRYFSFENFGVVNANVGASKTVTSANTWYLIGSTVISHDPKAGRFVISGSWAANGVSFDAYVYAVITTNAGETYTTPVKTVGPGKYSGDYYSTGTFTITVTKPFSGNSIQIDLYFEVYDYVVSGSVSSWSIDVSFDSLRAYFLADDHQGIISSLTSYTPVDGVLGQALKLDSTEILMNQVNLSSGTLTFNIKWDGTQTTILKDGSTPTLWIDSTGKVNVKNEDGTTFTSNASLTQGTWQKVVVAFQSDTLSGYIAIDDNQTSITWSGNFIADRVGDSTLSTSSLIDELNIYNGYMDLTAAAYGLTTYILKRPDGSTMTIYPEGGEQLGNITATFLDSAGNVLGTAILQESSPEADIPANTSKISLARGNVERVYLLENITSSTLAFPALGDLAVKVITAYIYPATYDVLEIKTLDGKIVFRDHINEKASFTALYGAYYVFTVQGEQGTFSIVAQATDNMVLNFPDPDQAFETGEARERLIANKDGDEIVITYISNSTVNGTVTILGKDRLGRIVQNVSLTFQAPAYNARFPISSGVSYYVIKIVTSTGFSASKVVATSLSMKFLIMDRIFPEGLRLMFFGFLGLFMVGRKHKELGPLLAFTVLSIMALIEWVTLPAFLTAQLAVLASLSLFFKAKEAGWIQ